MMNGEHFATHTTILRLLIVFVQKPIALARNITTCAINVGMNVKQLFKQKKKTPSNGNAVGNLSSYRDPDEGMCGPVYEACPDCVSKFYKSYEDECEWLDDEYY
jgi:hypothetical protein